jgi:hypothetical protein
MPHAGAAIADVTGLMTRAKPIRSASSERIARTIGARIVGVTLIDRHGIWARAGRPVPDVASRIDNFRYTHPGASVNRA